MHKVVKILTALATVTAFAAPASAADQTKNAQQEPSLKDVATQLNSTNDLLARIQLDIGKTQTPKDATSFCYHEDKAYSEGDQLNNGLTCARKIPLTVRYDKEQGPFPLYWEHGVKLMQKKSD